MLCEKKPFCATSRECFNQLMANIREAITFLGTFSCKYATAKFLDVLLTLHRFKSANIYWQYLRRTPKRSDLMQNVHYYACFSGMFASGNCIDVLTAEISSTLLCNIVRF